MPRNGTCRAAACVATAAVSSSSTTYLLESSTGDEYPAKNAGSTNDAAPEAAAGVSRFAFSFLTPGAQPSTSPPPGTHGRALPLTGSVVWPVPPTSMRGVVVTVTVATWSGLMTHPHAGSPAGA